MDINHKGIAQIIVISLLAAALIPIVFFGVKYAQNILSSAQSIPTCSTKMDISKVKQCLSRGNPVPTCDYYGSDTDRHLVGIVLFGQCARVDQVLQCESDQNKYYNPTHRGDHCLLTDEAACKKAGKVWDGSNHTCSNATTPVTNPAAGGGAKPDPAKSGPGSGGTGATTAQTLSIKGCDRDKLVVQQNTISGGGEPIVIPNPVCLSGLAGVNGLIITGVTTILVFGAVISFLMIVWGGIQYIMSAGDPKGVDGAKKRITYAIIGLAVSFTALVIMRILGTILGFHLIGS